MQIGRAVLRTPLDVQYVSRNAIDDGRLASGLSNPSMMTTGTEGYMLAAREQGATSQASMDALALERRRLGSVYVSDDSVVPALPAGYYAIEDFSYDKPRGAPYMRPYRVRLTATPMPLVVRYGYSDNIVGTDVADVTTSEGQHAARTPTTSESDWLRPRNVPTPEPLNLPAGAYRVIARAWQVGFSSGLLRMRFTDIAGSTIASGAQVAVGVADAWADVDLGTITIPAANDRANWYLLQHQGVSGELGQMRLDRIIFAPA